VRVLLRGRFSGDSPSERSWWAVSDDIESEQCGLSDGLEHLCGGVRTVEDEEQYRGL
jgi:hypothetical protein